MGSFNLGCKGFGLSQRPEPFLRLPSQDTTHHRQGAQDFHSRDFYGVFLFMILVTVEGHAGKVICFPTKIVGFACD